MRLLQDWNKRKVRYLPTKDLPSCKSYTRPFILGYCVLLITPSPSNFGYRCRPLEMFFNVKSISINLNKGGTGGRNEEGRRKEKGEINKIDR